MANIKSSKKDIRRSQRREERNAEQKSRLRTFDKKVRREVEEGNLDAAKETFRIYTRYLDRAGKRNLIHPGRADRKKGRIAKFLNQAITDSKAS